MRHNINAICEKFSLQIKQVYKKNSLASSQNKRGYTLREENFTGKLNLETKFSKKFFWFNPSV